MTKWMERVFVFFTLAALACVLGVTAAFIGDAINGASNPFANDPFPPATIIERPVTDTELVVGLAEVVSDLNREVKAARAETIALRNEAQQIINAMMREIERLRAGGGTRVVPTPAPVPTTEV